MKQPTFRVAWIGLLAVASCSQPPRDAESILFNGKIVTVDEALPEAQALAIANGRILAVGADDEIRALATADTQEIDLRGRTVVPGLADNHFHSAGGGPGVDLSRARTLEEVLAAIADRVRESEAAEVIVTNSDWHEAQLREQRLPLRRDLDTVAPDNPVVVVRGGHEYVLNSAALEKWNITKETEVPAAGQISRYDDGELNGELVDAAKRLVSLARPPAKDFEARIEDQLREHQTLHAVGLTSIRHPGASLQQYRVLEEMRNRGLLKMRVSFLFRLGRAGSADGVAKAVESWDVKAADGDEWLRIDGVKLGIDGGFEGGWMREPYAEPWGRNGTFYGLQTMPQDVYTDVVGELNRRGWRVATHAVGDAAIDQVLAGYAAAHAARSIADRRWVLEHGFVPGEDQFDRIRELGLAVSAQHHLYVAGPSLEKYWGRSRAEWMTPVRSYIDRGIAVSLGTDSPVVPYPPLWVIYHFVSRDTITGGVFGEDQRISREEALRAITLGNAYLSFEEDIKGSLSPGKLADLVVLSADILTCPVEQIRDTSVLLTMVNGEIVYRSESF